MLIHYSSFDLIHQPLIRAYIGQGLRVDLERLEGGPELSRFVESLKRRGVSENIISEAIAELSGTEISNKKFFIMTSCLKHHTRPAK